MRRLAALLALLLAAPLAAQSPGAAYKLDQVAVRLDGGAGGSGFSTPTGCVATSVPIFLGSPVALGCDDGLTYDAVADTLTTTKVAANNVTATALATPTITSPLTVNGTPGVVTYGYKRVCFLNDGTSTAASAEVTVATGPATLGAVNNITVAWPAVTGEAYSEVYRTTGNGALGEAPPILIYSGTAPTTIDVGAPGTSKVPATVNTTGVVTADRVLVGNGTAAAPAYAFSGQSGLYSVNTYVQALSQGGGPAYYLTDGNLNLMYVKAFGWGTGPDASGAPDTTLSRGAAAVVKSNGGYQWTTGSRPTCDAAARGMTWYVAGGSGAADTLEACLKAAADTYAWVPVATNP